MNKSPIFRVKKCTLLAIAGCVWFLAGFNVARFVGCSICTFRIDVLLLRANGFV